VEGQARQGRTKVSRTNRRTKNDTVSFKNGLYVFAFFLACIFLLPILFFCITAARDPMAPTILKDGLRVLKDRTFGYLGKRRE
jgi:hypothetical protein